ncbi:MAG: membrane protein [Candidatus Azotimanducaceae bacterium]|jgi:membrane protein
MSVPADVAKTETMMEFIEPLPKRLVNFLKYLWQNFSEDNCARSAAALTYQSLFAVVPFLTLMYGMFRIASAFDGLGQKVEELIFGNIIPGNVSVVQEYLHSFSDQTSNLGIPSVILLAVVSFLMLVTIERTFNDIWSVKSPRHGFQRFLIYWLVLTLGPLFFGIALATSTYLMSLSFITDVARSTQFLDWLPIILSSVMFTLFYYVIPNSVVPLRHAAIGGVVIAILFEIAKLVFSTVMGQSSFEVIYGAFAAVPLFLFWIYVSWTIILLGAEFVKSLGVYRFKGSHKVEERLVQIIFLLELFYRAHQKGEVLTELDIRAHGSRINLEEWSVYKHQLIELNLIRAVDRGGLVLSKDLNEVSVWDLYTSLPWKLPTVVKGEEGWEKKLSERFSDLYKSSSSAMKGDLETLFKAN